AANVPRGKLMETERPQVEIVGDQIGGGTESGHMRILVVEDDKKIASFIIKGLKQSGFAVDHAANGEDGLILATTTPYDAAVVDIMLPKLDGLSLVQELRNRRINLPVLILSAGKVVSKALLLEHVWDYSFDPQPNVVDVVVCRLRNKIDRDFGKKMIHTLRGVGYALKAD